MKLIASNLRNLIRESGLQISEIVKRMNIIQEQITPGKRPVTRNCIYSYMKGHSPTSDKMYILASILRNHPKDIFILSVDENMIEETKRLAKELRVTI